MQGTVNVIAALNDALKEELTAINQYFLHAEMCENWHYDKLGEHIKKQSTDERKHAEALIERILFLDATPNMTELLHLTVGQNVKAQLVERSESGNRRTGHVHRAIQTSQVGWKII